MPLRGTLDVSKAKKLLNFHSKWSLDIELSKIYHLVQRFIEVIIFVLKKLNIRPIIRLNCFNTQQLKKNLKRYF